MNESDTCLMSNDSNAYGNEISQLTLKAKNISQFYLVEKIYCENQN